MNEPIRGDTNSAAQAMGRLVDLMARLRAPDGCAWDREQTPATLKPQMLEECYEVVEAIDSGSPGHLTEELGDLLLHIVFQAQIAREAGQFAFADVANAIADKLVRRHPHVFGDVTYADLDEQKRAWDEIKARERAAKGPAHDDSALSGVSRGQPEWQRALKLQQRAATVGFDWPDHRPVIDKLHEELAEVQAEFDAGAPHARLEDEIGDVLFVAVNLARHAGVDFARALKHANAKFERRFRRMEQLAADEGEPLSASDLAAQEALWQRAKAEERKA